MEFFLSEIRELKEQSILNLTNNDKETPLHLAVSLDNKEVAEKLIVSKADANCKDANGDTALHLAVKKDNSDIVEVLFRCAANVAIDEENNGKLFSTTPKKKTIVIPRNCFFRW